jgi:hypothetical protein
LHVLADGGAALVESVREGRGPRGLSLTRFLFCSADRFISLFTDLRGNTYLGRFDLNYMFFLVGSSQALVCVFLENKGLLHFGLRFCTILVEAFRHPKGVKEPRRLRRCCESTRKSIRFRLTVGHRLIVMARMHSSPRELRAISTGSGLLQSRR